MVKNILLIFIWFGSIPCFATDSTKVILELSFIGDIMQHSPQIKSAYNPIDDNYNYLPCFRTIAPSIRQADLVFANLELTLAGKPFSGYPAFSAPDELAVALKKSGIDVLVTANNHSLDRRKKGLERTIDVLDSLLIPHTGTFKNEIDRAKNYPLMINKKGIDIALLNYTYGTNGIPVTAPNIVNLLDTAQMKIDIEKAKACNPDLLIVFTHWGLEYQRLPNHEQRTLTRFFQDLGVDLVIGSHPHVLQPIERKGDFVVVYSLGNFISNQRDRFKDGGMIVSTIIEFDTISNSKSMKEASYELTWVYKKRDDYGSEYYILPASHPNSYLLIESENDRNNMRQFVTDSRLHFQKNNKGDIGEYKIHIKELPHYNLIGKLGYNIQPADHPNLRLSLPSIEKKNTIEQDVKNESKSVFRIQFLATTKKISKTSFDPDYFPGIFTENVNGIIRYMTGEFATREMAEDHLLILVNETKYKDAFIVEKPIY